MSWTRFFRRKKWDAERARELDSYLENETADNIARGIPPDEARFAAQRKLGNTTSIREEIYRMNSIGFLETLWQDVRFGSRAMRKNPAFTCVAILVIALGIGASTAIFSVVSGVLLRPLPYPNQNHLLRVQESHPDAANLNLTFATFLDFVHAATKIENVSAFRPWNFNLTGDVSDPLQVRGAMVSADFFYALGTHPAIGRVFTAENDRPGGETGVALLSDSLWQSRFGGDPGIVGRIIQINAQDFTVIGVMPAGFDFPDKSEIWTPLVPGGSLRANRRAHLLTVIADLRKGQSLSTANGELSTIANQIDKQNPGVDDPGLSLAAVPLKKNMVAPVQPALIVLGFAVALLLIIACANVANLLLARSACRRKEIAIRLAIGAARGRLLRQLLTESILLSSLGGILGIAIASWSLSLVVALSRESLPRIAEIAIDWPVLLFGLVLSLFTGMLFGIAPAFAGMRLDMKSTLKEGGAIAPRTVRRGSSQALVVTQFALAMILLVGAGLVGTSYARILRVNIGFNPHNLLTMRVFLSPTMYPEDSPRGAIVLGQMLDRIRAVPGVRSAGLVNTLPITGGVDTDIVLNDRPAPPVGSEPSADICVIDPGYFRTMETPLRSGREFNERDSASSRHVMMVNETLARRFWPNESPIGKSITMKDWGPPLTGEIVGVVADIKNEGLDTTAKPTIYWPYTQFPQIFNAFVVRGDSDPIHLVSAIKSRIWSVDRTQTVSAIATMDQILVDSVSRRRLYMVLLGIFAGAAFLLAAVGIFGVSSYSVNQRTREIGVRVALGAQKGDVMRLVLWHGTRLALIGVALGLLGALALTRLMSSLLFSVSATDPYAFAGVALLLTIVAAAACYLPARRATRVDPMVALRYE